MLSVTLRSSRISPVNRSSTPSIRLVNRSSTSSILLFKRSSTPSTCSLILVTVSSNSFSSTNCFCTLFLGIFCEYNKTRPLGRVLLITNEVTNDCHRGHRHQNRLRGGDGHSSGGLR